MAHDTEHKTPTTLPVEGLDNTTDPNHEKSTLNKLSRRRLFGLSAGGLAIAAALSVGIGIGVNSKSEQGHEIPVATQPGGESPSSAQSTSETTGTTPEVFTVESLELSADLTPEQLGTTILQDRIPRWFMAGSVGGDKLEQDWIRTNLPEDDFLAPTIANNGDTFANALFVPNWRENPKLVKLIDNIKVTNLNSLELWLKTYKSGDSNDKEPFKRTASVDSTSVNSRTTDTLSITIAGTDHTNADKNRAAKLNPNVVLVEGSKFTMDINLQLINGEWKISALDSKLS